MRGLMGRHASVLAPLVPVVGRRHRRTTTGTLRFALNLPSWVSEGGAGVRNGRAHRSGLAGGVVAPARSGGVKAAGW